MIEVKIDSQSVTEALRRLAASAADPEPALKMIGERMVRSTKKRFKTSTAPDGAKWLPNKPSTLKRKKGNKPLIGATHSLATQISYAVSLDTLKVGSPMIYAATQQFGASRGQFGKNKRNHPIPWGDIPARPFLGVSKEDEEMIDNTVAEYLHRAVRG